MNFELCNMYLMQVRDIDANVAGISCFSSCNLLNINQFASKVHTNKSDNTESPQILNCQLCIVNFFIMPILRLRSGGAAIFSIVNN